MSDAQLFSEIATLPEKLKDEVADFVGYLKQKEGKIINVKPRKPGALKGSIIMADDFDDPLEDFKDYM